MLDFIWNGLGLNQNQRAPRNPCQPAYHSRPHLIHKPNHNTSSFHHHNNYFPNTSCCLIPQKGSIADSLFNGNLFFPHENSCKDGSSLNRDQPPFKQQNLNPTRTTQPPPNSCFNPQYGSPADKIFNDSIFFSYNKSYKNVFKILRFGPYERAWC